MELVLQLSHPVMFVGCWQVNIHGVTYKLVAREPLDTVQRTTQVASPYDPTRDGSRDGFQGGLLVGELRRDAHGDWGVTIVGGRPPLTRPEAVLFQTERSANTLRRFWMEVRPLGTPM